jgi:pimeloyl-ACP methyl ester carboxylesterase
MPPQVLTDGDEVFDVTLLESPAPSRLVLFAVGGGGNPERHLPLLNTLVEQGCTVVAPHFARLASPFPTDADLLVRARRLRLALDAAARPGLPAAGVGHSIGAAVLVALAGGRMWTRPEGPLSISPDGRLDRLALLAPATGFFRAPMALDGVRIPILAWAGTNDAITPPDQALLLATALGERVAVTVRITERAGHFSFMDNPPPHTTEPLPDREAFLAEVRAAVLRFVTGPS